MQLLDYTPHINAVREAKTEDEYTHAYSAYLNESVYDQPVCPDEMKSGHSAGALEFKRVCDDKRKELGIDE